jgi:D-glycero-alpha-D-manno-heptose-7-phosphate kinase
MIISRTPFRMSFIGGGTDLPAFYEKQQGAVISTAIDKYVYITVNQRFDETIRVSYSKTEILDKLDDMRHTRFRETMRETGTYQGVEITSIADIPAGTGLGSSSSFTVGLFNALHAYHGRYQSARELAEAACKLEMVTIQEPIGKQDQYAAAYGGLRRYLFNSDGSVFVDPVVLSDMKKRQFFDSIMLYHVGGERKASDILGSSTTPDSRMRALVDDFWKMLTIGDIRGLGEILHEGWEAKKRTGAITSPEIDECYAAARSAGASGGKILGAGGAGFLMLYVDSWYQREVRKALRKTSVDPRWIPFNFEQEGSKIIYVTD